MSLNCKTQNIKEDVKDFVNEFIDKLKSRKEVKAILLLGGLGKRSFMDEFSDIDISVVTTSKEKESFPLPFEFHVRHKDKIMEFNIHQLIVEEELDDNNRWNDSKIEAYSNAIIEYDPFDYAKKILKQNVVFDNKRAFNRLVWILQQYKWRGQIHSIRCYYRGCPQASHDLLNNCVELLLEAVYLLNERYVPHKKWEFIFLDELEYGCDLKSLFANAMLVKSFTFESILERIEVLDKIFKQIEEMAYKKYKDFPSRPYEFYYRNFVQLNKVTKADEFYFEMTGKLDVENNKDELIFGKICYDVDKL